MSDLWGQPTEEQFRAYAAGMAREQLGALFSACGGLDHYPFQFEPAALERFQDEITRRAALFLRHTPVQRLSALASAEKLSQPVDIARQRLLRDGLQRFLNDALTPPEAGDDHA